MSDKKAFAIAVGLALGYTLATFLAIGGFVLVNKILSTGLHQASEFAPTLVRQDH